MNLRNESTVVAPHAKRAGRSGGGGRVDAPLGDRRPGALTPGPYRPCESEHCSPRLLASRAPERVGGLWAFGRGSGQQGQSNQCTPLDDLPPSTERSARPPPARKERRNTAGAYRRYGG